MMDENEEVLFSQLADGELPSDQANELLLDVLDDATRRRKLAEMLHLRQMTVAWRTRQPQRPIASEQKGTFRHGRTSWRVSSLAVAACVGGLLVLAGGWAAGLLANPSRSVHQWQIALRPPASPSALQVTPEQMQQVADVFALHESVAGPLAWYASDEQNVRLSSAGGAGLSHAPIGVLLKLELAVPGPADPAATRASARTFVIVCRNDQPTVIELPAETPDKSGLRVYFSPRAVNGKVEMQYAIAVDGDPQQAPLASLSGQRRLGLAESSLGQLAMGDRVLNIDAAAWSMRQEHE